MDGSISEIGERGQDKMWTFVFDCVYSLDMPETQTIHIRLSDDELSALKRAAAREDRRLAAMGRMIIVRWLRDQKLLPALDAEGDRP